MINRIQLTKEMKYGYNDISKKKLVQVLSVKYSFKKTKRFLLCHIIGLSLAVSVFQIKQILSACSL